MLSCPLSTTYYYHPYYLFPPTHFNHPSSVVYSLHYSSDIRPSPSGIFFITVPLPTVYILLFPTVLPLALYTFTTTWLSSSSISSLPLTSLLSLWFVLQVSLLYQHLVFTIFTFTLLALSETALPLFSTLIQLRTSITS